MFAVTLWNGCAHSRIARPFSARTEHCRQSNCAVCPADQGPHTLDTSQFDERPSIQLGLNLDIPEAAPIAADQPLKVRILVPHVVERLAAEHSSLAHLLMSDQQGDSCESRCGPLNDALEAQAEFERNQSVAEALTAYYRLTLVYLQNGLNMRSAAELDRFTSMLARLEEAGLARSIEQGQIDQTRFEIWQNRSKLEYSQRLLTAQLRELLNLEPHQLEPIWPDFEPTESLVSDGVQSEIETAWNHRGDLRALEHLLCLAPEDLIGGQSGWLSGAHPLLGASRVAQLRRWQLLFCKHRMALQSEWMKRQCQLLQLIEAKRSAIAIEVEEIWYSLDLRQQLIASKQLALADLDANWHSRIAGKDIRPLSFADETDYSKQRIQLISELVQERIELEIDLVRLQRAQGTLGRRFAQSMN